jgi:hypothetical protein
MVKQTVVIWRATLSNVMSEATCNRWYSYGTTYAALAAAGGPYLLLLLACKGIRTWINGRPYEVIKGACRIIRSPNLSTPMGRDVIYGLIPTISKLQKTLPCTFNAAFSRQILVAQGLPKTLRCHNMADCDKFFEMMIDK